MQIIKFLIKLNWVIFFLSVCFFACEKKQKLPEGFVFLKNVDPFIIENQRYFTKHNFVGKPISSYLSPHIICTKEAAENLKNANIEFKKLGYQLVVYDGYRPQRAVNEFMDWAKDQTQTKNKKYYYPNLSKSAIFPKGYVSEKSAHSRGSTFDLTLIKLGKKIKPIIYSYRKLKSSEEIHFLDDGTVDMGSSWDLFHEVSAHQSKLIDSFHGSMRDKLKEVMEKNHFKAYEKEWWHYTLEKEPFPDTYFDFIIKNYD